MSLKLTALTLALLFAGCASREPIRLGAPEVSGNSAPGVLWGTSASKKQFFERWNHAAVRQVDSTQTVGLSSVPPVVLTPGKHTIQIEYKRDSYFCGYLGCISIHQTTRTVELQVKPDHSYLPLAGKYCEKDWIWIVDTGGSARKELENWREHGILPYMPFDPRSPLKDVSGLNVVAGEAPPDHCEPEEK